MKLKIQVAAGDNIYASVAGNVVVGGKADYLFDFEPTEHYYFFVAEGHGTLKGQSAAEAALEHLRDSFSFGDIGDESGADDILEQLKYISLECNGIYPHLAPGECCGTTLCGAFGSNGSLISVNASEGCVYIFRGGKLYPLVDTAPALGYCGSGKDTYITTLNQSVQEGDIVLICSWAVKDRVTDEEIEDTLNYSNYPAEHLMEQAVEAGGGDSLAVIAVKVGDGDFVEDWIDTDEEPDSFAEPWA